MKDVINKEVASQRQSPPTQILDATFQLSDKHGASPVVSISIGKDKDPAYQPPDQQGYFTPGRSVRKNLQKEFEVSFTSHSLKVIVQLH